MARRHMLAALAAAAALLPIAAANPFGTTFSGDGTYYGTRQRGFGHCSFHFYGFGTSPGYAGTPLAINAPQYAGAALCGLCVRFRGSGGGAGGNPIAGGWQPGFICDECPECAHGSIDLQTNGDGRWKVQWEPVQCPVGGSTFKFGHQNSNPYYVKLMVANARVPVAKVEIKRFGSWQQLVKTIDNHHEYYGSVGDAWNQGGCAAARITSILGDSVEDMVCCTSGTCEGKAQFPCRSDMPGDCAGAAPSDDTANKRIASRPRALGRGAQCGGTKFECAKFGPGQCKDGVFTTAKCGPGLRCTRNDANFWGCK